jgi:hypothetical protein
MSPRTKLEWLGKIRDHVSCGVSLYPAHKRLTRGEGRRGLRERGGPRIAHLSVMIKKEARATNFGGRPLSLNRLRRRRRIR